MERVGKDLAEEEKRLDGVDNGLTAYIPSLGQLCMRLVPKNVTATSLTAHYKTLNLDLRKDDASDLSSEDEHIDPSIPITCPGLTVMKIVRRIMRFNRLENENLYPRHYHKRQIPTWRGIKMLREVDRRKRLAAEARVDTLPSKWDIPARERARFNWQKYCDMDIHGKRSKEGHRCLLLSDYDFQREIKTRKALYGYVKYSQRKSHWEAMEEDDYSPLKVAKFCSDMYSGIQFLPKRTIHRNTME